MASQKQQQRERPKTYWEPNDEQATNYNRVIKEQWEKEDDKGTYPLATFMAIVKRAAHEALEENWQMLKNHTS
jgi:hypothetical protein